MTSSSAVLAAAIIVGSILGAALPAATTAARVAVSPTVLLLIGCLFLELRSPVGSGEAGRRRVLYRGRWTVALSLVINFVIIPGIAYVLVTLVLPHHPAAAIGLFIYLIAPCTDWFLGFTRVSGGNVALGSVLLPMNLIIQLVLYPVLLMIFFGRQVTVQPGTITTALMVWFIAPLIIARLLAGLLRRVSPKLLASVQRDVGRVVRWVMAALIVEIFAANGSVIIDQAVLFGHALLAVIIFFPITFLIGEVAGRWARIRTADRVLLTMTTAARNAPLMLAVTAVALPELRVGQAAIVIGMLIEFPHLVAISAILRHRQETLRAQQSGSRLVPHARRAAATDRGADPCCPEVPRDDAGGVGVGDGHVDQHTVPVGERQAPGQPGAVAAPHPGAADRAG